MSAYTKFERRESLKRRESSCSGASGQLKVEPKKRRGSRAGSKSTEVNPDLVKTATYIKHLFVVTCFCFMGTLHNERKRSAIVPEKYVIQLTVKGHTNLGNL